MTEFKITFKREKWWLKRRSVTVLGDSYFISDKDSNGYTRFVIIMYETDGSRKHQFICNANDVLYTIFKPSNWDYETEG